MKCDAGYIKLVDPGHSPSKLGSQRGELADLYGHIRVPGEQQWNWILLL
jgi:hypothetical protein